MFYILIEVADDLLHDALAAYTMIHIKDPSRKPEMEPKIKEIRDILRNSDRYNTSESVQRIIDEYAPIVRSLYSTK